MEILNCYFCNEEEEVSNFEQYNIDMFFCNDCQQWQCNTEECGCLCKLNQAQWFEMLVDNGTSPKEILAYGIEDLKNKTWDLILSSDIGPKVVNRIHSDGIATDIYREAQEREEQNIYEGSI